MIEYINQDEQDLIQTIRFSVDKHPIGAGKIVFSEHRKGLHGEIVSKDSIIYINKRKYIKLLLDILSGSVL